MSAEPFLKNQAQQESSWLRLVYVAGTFSAVVVIVQAWLLADAMASVVFQGKTLADILPLLWGLLGLAALRFAVNFGGSYVLTKVGSRIKQALRLNLLQHLQKLGPVYVVQQGSGSLLTTLMEGVDAVIPYYTRYLPAKVFATVIPLAMLVAVFPFDRIAGFTLLITAPLIPVFMIFIGKGAQQKNQEQWQQLARLGNHLLDAIRGLPLLKMFQAARREQQAVATMAETYRQKTMSVLRIAFLSSLALEFFATVSIALVAVFIGFRLLWGTFDFQSGFFILLLAPEFFLPLRQLGTAHHARMEAVAAAEKMADIMATPLPATGTKTLDLKPEEGLTIRFENVSFTYGAEPVLQDFTLTLTPGTHTALMGPTGIGKSTVMALLLGFIEPTAGRITINGMPLSELDITAWRQQISWVPQTAHIFPGTVLENIRLGHPSLSEEAARQLCINLQADAFIQTLPQQYHTRIGEGGVSLSAGQMQRLALVRAFARPAPLVLLDEPTAGLDHKTEALVLQGMQQLFAGKTVLSIAHRANTVAGADVRHHLQAGKLAA